MRSRPFACLLSVVSLSFASIVHAQDPLDEMYGQAVHSYFRGDSTHASELLTEVIDAGSLDPRAFFFRGLTQSYGGVDMSNPDFERGAQLEIEGKKVVNVGKALERIQGHARVAIEKARAKARLAARSRMLEIQRARYEEMQQKAGADRGGILVPPRNDAAPAPGVFAPNDPFSQGMTKGDPKAMPKKPAEETPDEFAPDTSMPAEPAPVEAKDPNDPF
jgi:hypothetical protein